MIIRAGSDHLLAELHDELAAKTLRAWNSHARSAYDHYVPWMSCLPEIGEVVVDHPALSHRYDHGLIVSSVELLNDINKYLGLLQARPIAEDILKNLPPEGRNHAIAQEQVSQHIIDGFSTAKRGLLSSHPIFAILFDRIVHAVIPIRLAQERMNESLDLARGAIFMSLLEPLDIWALQLDLAHEFGHQALMIMNSADPLFTSDIATPVFSGVRLIERPAIQSLHAATALAFMILFARDNTDVSAQQATATFATQLGRTLDSLRDNCSMTEVGQSILDDYRRLCEDFHPASAAKGA